MDRGTKRQRHDEPPSVPNKRARLHETTMRQLRAEIARLQGEVEQLKQQCRVYHAHILRAYAYIYEANGHVAATAPTMAVDAF